MVSILDFLVFLGYWLVFIEISFLIIFIIFKNYPLVKKNPASRRDGFTVYFLLRGARRFFPKCVGVGAGRGGRPPPPSRRAEADLGGAGGEESKHSTVSRLMDPPMMRSSARTISVYSGVTSVNAS